MKHSRSIFSAVPFPSPSPRSPQGQGHNTFCSENVLSTLGPYCLQYRLLNSISRGESRQQLSPDMRFPTMWYVRLAKAQTSLRICAD